MSSTCELCNFKNPKGSVSAVIIKNSQMLLLRRSEEPMRGAWDLPGGYMQADEIPLQAIKRELKEELNLDTQPEYIDVFTGWNEWKGERFPVLNFAFLIVLKDEEIKLNDENSTYCWQTIQFMEPDRIAFDSNQKIATWVKHNLNFDMQQVRELATQLDKSVVVDEFALYKAVLGGHVAKKYDGQKLIGLGYISFRQTMLRKQAVIDDMIVSEEYRGKGLGRDILKELIDWAKKNGVEVIELTTGHHREAAYKLYESEGFVFHNTRHMLKKI